MAFALDVKALRYFCAVAEYGSYTQAAVHLRVTQPVITRQVQAIERNFGVRLFARSGRSMALTPVGNALLVHARDVLARIDSTEALLQRIQSEPIGNISIGIPLSLGAVSLTDAFGSFHMKYPRVTFQATSGNSTEFAYMLAEGRLDIALVYGQPAQNQLDFEPLARIPLGLVYPVSRSGADDPLEGRERVSLAEAAGLPLILPSRGHSLRSFVESSCNAIGMAPRVVFESDGPAVTKELSLNGHGYAVLGLPSVRNEVAEGKLRFVEIAPGLEPWYLSVATRKGKRKSAAVELMVQEIVSTVRSGRERDAPL